MMLRDWDKWEDGMNNGRWIQRGGGNDTIDLRWQAPWDVYDNANGGDGNDLIYGNLADNQLLGGNGADTIYGEWGNDRIEGGNGNDSLSGGFGDDKVWGGANDDSIAGNDGHDDLYGDEGNDVLQGNAGDDWMYGGSGNDALYGDSGNDRLDGGLGADIMRGGSGSDALISTAGADKVYGDDGADRVYLSGANTRLSEAGLELRGGSGDDTLFLLTPTGTSLTVNGLGANVTGFEGINIEDSTMGTMTLSFRDVIRTADNDHLRIEGDWRDTVRLQDDVAGDVLTGGNWERAQIQSTVTSSDGEFFTRYDYRAVDGGQILASVSVENDVDVMLV
jgi:Ca2+-binding RTX toxin-like protein